MVKKSPNGPETGSSYRVVKLVTLIVMYFNVIQQIRKDIENIL